MDQAHSVKSFPPFPPENPKQLQGVKMVNIPPPFSGQATSKIDHQTDSILSGKYSRSGISRPSAGEQQFATLNPLLFFFTKWDFSLQNLSQESFQIKKNKNEVFNGKKLSFIHPSVLLLLIQHRHIKKK